MTFSPLTTPIDYVLLAGERSPGVADVTGADSVRELQERRGYGLGGAFVVYKGIKLIKPKITLKLFTPEHWEAWHEWKRIVERPPTGRRARAVDIWHPILEDQGVTSVLIESVSQPTQTADGEWSIVIACTEYRRPVRALATPSGSDTETLTPEELALTAAEAQGRELRRQNDILSGAVR